MTVLVTRPQPQADQWVQALQAAGIAAEALPLLAIQAPAAPDAVAQLWRTLAQHRAVMFVSPAAAHWFFQLRPTDCHWPEQTLAASPGPGTAGSLVTLGADASLRPEQIVQPPADAAQFDSEHLWPQLAPLDWQGQQVAVLSGSEGGVARGRDWLTEQWRAAGATVHKVATYQRGPADWDAAALARIGQALAAPEGHLWLLSSSEALRHLIRTAAPQLPAAPDWSRVRALCTHPRIAERAREAGLVDVQLGQPTTAAVVEALRARVDTMKPL